jgi:hypothetical protein
MSEGVFIPVVGRILLSGSSVISKGSKLVESVIGAVVVETELSSDVVGSASDSVKSEEINQ